MWSKKICQDWSNGVPPLDRFKLVFRVALSLVKSNVPIEQILVDQSFDRDSDYTCEDIKHVLKELAEQVLLVFDGLDEFDLDINRDIKDIVEGKYLKKASVLITSRPERVTAQIEHKFDSVGQMLGFTEQARDDLMLKFLKDEAKVACFKELIKKLDDDLQKRYKDKLQDLCFHPLFCVMLLILYIENKTLPATRTLILQEIIKLMTCRNFVRSGMQPKAETAVNFTLTQLGRHAWCELLKGSVTLYKVCMVKTKKLNDFHCDTTGTFV